MRNKKKSDAPFVVALTLAQEMAAAVRADAAERDTLVDAALCVGQWLADEGRPGRWDTVDVGAVLEQRSCTSERETTAFLVALGGLIGHAGFCGYVPVETARRNLLDIGGLSRSPIVRGFVDKAAVQLQRLAG
jgi:hypothetical protein